MPICEPRWEKKERKKPLTHKAIDEVRKAFHICNFEGRLSKCKYCPYHNDRSCIGTLNKDLEFWLERMELFKAGLGNGTVTTTADEKYFGYCESI